MTQRLLAAALLSSGCGELGVTLDVSAQSNVPSVDELRVQVTQNGVVTDQTFPLSRALPQSVAIVSRGMTRGAVDVVVQGLFGGSVVGLGRATAELKPATQALHVAVELERYCPGGVCGCRPTLCSREVKSCGLLDDGCDGTRDCGTCTAGDECRKNVCVPPECRPKTCVELGINCGTASDGCDGKIECGECSPGLYCGGSGRPNVCGPDMCGGATGCDAGQECGLVSDGCGRMISCGTCDGGVCGAAAQNRCCYPLRVCPNGLNCGSFSDGCGGMLDCGTCTPPQTCGGAGPRNVCGCIPTTGCSGGRCGMQPDGCGGTYVCPTSCSSLSYTCQLPQDGGSRHCACMPGTTDCGGACVDLSTSAANCGTCGQACPLGQGCSGGVCPCVDAGSNIDGHCCPPGWSLEDEHDRTEVHCYKGPLPAATRAQAETVCAAETLAGYGRGVPAVGRGRSSDRESAVPATACGTYLEGLVNSEVLEVEGQSLIPRSCTPSCVGPACQCLTCTCGGAQWGCTQRFYCVMDPFGPGVEGPCTSDGQCAPGLACQSGACGDSGTTFCIEAADCTSPFGNCAARGGGQTGLCR